MARLSFGIPRRNALVGAAIAAGLLGGACAHGGSVEVTAAKRRVSVLGADMAYVERGTGRPIVFLHGNPTSSYLWRNILPHVARLGRCIAPDLAGMGDSAKLSPSGPGIYRFHEHFRRLERLLDDIGADDGVILVVHDWGGALGFHWAMQNARRVKAVAFMETFVVSQTAANTPPPALEFFRNFRTERMAREVLENNYFVEQVLLRQLPALNEIDRTEYRRPFIEPGEARRPTLEWPRQVPLDGDPADVHEAALAHLDWMARSDVPKLFIRSEPGGLIAWGRENVCRAWRNVEERTVPGRHFIQEESPHEIGTHLRAWIEAL